MLNKTQMLLAVAHLYSRESDCLFYERPDFARGTPEHIDLLASEGARYPAGSCNVPRYEEAVAAQLNEANHMLDLANRAHDDASRAGATDADWRFVIDEWFGKECVE